MKYLLKYLIQPYNLLSLFVLFFILHPNKDSPLSPLSTSSPPPFTPPPLSLLRYRKASPGYQPALTHQVAVRLSTSSSIKAA